jgi:hypothetical protein
LNFSELPLSGTICKEVDDAAGKKFDICLALPYFNSLSQPYNITIVKGVIFSPLLN